MSKKRKENGADDGVSTVAAEFEHACFETREAERAASLKLMAEMDHVLYNYRGVDSRLEGTGHGDHFTSGALRKVYAFNAASLFNWRIPGFFQFFKNTDAAAEQLKLRYVSKRFDADEVRPLMEAAALFMES